MGVAQRRAAETHERYEDLGGVGGALARQAEQLLNGLGDEGRERAKWILLELVQVGRGVPDTGRPRTRQEVLTAAGGDELAGQVLMRLSGMRTGAPDSELPGLRLVVLSGGPDPALQRIDLVHETLLQKVPSLAAWIERERVLLERHADLEAAAQAWEQKGCPADWLPSGTLLAHYCGDTDSSHSRNLSRRRMSDRAMRYLEAARRLDRRRMGLRFAAVAVIVLTALVALWEQRRAEVNLEQFIEATDQVVSDTDWTLGRRGGTLEARRELLGTIAGKLALVPERDRAKPKVRESIVKANHRLGDLAFLDDTLADAKRVLLAALTEIQRAGDGGLTFQYGLNHSKLGKVAQAEGQPSAPVDMHFGNLTGADPNEQ